MNQITIQFECIARMDGHMFMNPWGHMEEKASAGTLVPTLLL